MGAVAKLARPAIGQVEYVCWIIDGDKLCAAAKKRGWKEDDANGGGPLDYAEPYDFEYGRSFSSKDAAIAYANEHYGDDFFGQISIRRRTFRRDRITPLLVEWKDDYEWIVSGDGIDSESTISADDED